MGLTIVRRNPVIITIDDLFPSTSKWNHKQDHYSRTESRPIEGCLVFKMTRSGKIPALYLFGWKGMMLTVYTVPHGIVYLVTIFVVVILIMMVVSPNRDQIWQRKIVFAFLFPFPILCHPRDLVCNRAW